ncbi:MAG: hypothetical protein CM15mP12_5010 [Gammaproteobacteria bacterium]|nr:MAG: hypothetical protein CM15mP12_5010 [Gammaproteobacteria bacterium]
MGLPGIEQDLGIFSQTFFDDLANSGEYPNWYGKKNEFRAIRDPNFEQ